MTEEQRLKRLERAKAWNEAHPDRLRQNQRLYVARHGQGKRTKEKQRAASARFRAQNPWMDSLYAAKQRCTNPNHPAFRRYGGKGIQFLLSKADARFLWIRDKANLLNQPSIDRIDNDGNYSLENCRFIEKSENSRKIAWDRMIRIERLRETAPLPRACAR